MEYFLGADVGGTKTNIAICDENGNIHGFGTSGPGNPQEVGYPGLLASLQTALQVSTKQAGITSAQISAAGFGIAGYDWPSTLPKMTEVVEQLGLDCPYKIVNDAVLGLVAGARDGWGISVVSGTGCNCRGWDKDRQREGRVTGFGSLMGEGAGASELVQQAMLMVGYSWAKRVPPTRLCEDFIRFSGAKNLEDLLEGYTEGHYSIGAKAAPLVIKAAMAGDEVAIDLLIWAGKQLGEMANCVARQLDFEKLAYEVVMVGSMFRENPIMVTAMRDTILLQSPKATLTHLTEPPVLGALVIGIETHGKHCTAMLRGNMTRTLLGSWNS